MNRATNKVLNYTFAILLLSVYSITCQAQNSFVKDRVTYSIGTRLKKTYLKINAGDIVQVTASGKMVFHGIAGSAGPDGIDGFADRCMDPVFPYGALLYKVGEDDWVLADPDNPLTADHVGYLKLMVNDNDPSRNRGRFLVKVTVKSSKANGGHQIINRPVPGKAKYNIAPGPRAVTTPEKPKDNVVPIQQSGAALEKPKENIAPTPHPVAVAVKAKDNVAATSHPVTPTVKAKDNVAATSHPVATPAKAKDNVAAASHPVATPAKAKDNVAAASHPVAAVAKAKDNVAATPHPVAAVVKAKDNIATTPNSVIAPEKVKKNIAPIPRSAAGLLTLPQLQQLSTYSAKAAKSFLTSKRFRVDGESDDQTNKYDFNNNDITAYIIKYVKENQATFSTSSEYNYEAIIASLHKYRYTPRELVTKAEGVTKYANSRYSMSIVLSQLNNKPQYLFVVKKL